MLKIWPYGHISQLNWENISQIIPISMQHIINDHIHL